MTEEVQEQETTQEGEEQVTQAPSQNAQEIRTESVDAAEERARNSGWMPLEDWEAKGKDPADWVDARVYNMRGELMSRISNQTDALKHQKQQMEQMMKIIKAQQEANQKKERAAYEKAMEDLRREKVAALTDLDSDKAYDIEKRMDDLREARRLEEEELKAQEAQEESQQQDVVMVPGANGEQIPLTHEQHQVLQWLQAQRSDWAGDEDVFRSAAWYADELLAQGIPPSEAYDKIKTRMFQRFSHLGGNRQAPRSGVDDTGARTVNRNRRSAPKYTTSDLNDMELSIAKGMVGSGKGKFKSVQDYIDAMASDGALMVQIEGRK